MLSKPRWILEIQLLLAWQHLSFIHNVPDQLAQFTTRSFTGFKMFHGSVVSHNVGCLVSPFHRSSVGVSRRFSGRLLRVVVCGAARWPGTGCYQCGCRSQQHHRWRRRRCGASVGILLCYYVGQNSKTDMTPYQYVAWLLQQLVTFNISCNCSQWQSTNMKS